MEINKISVGAEAIPVTKNISLLSQSKVINIRLLSRLVFLKISSAAKKIIFKLVHLLRQIKKVLAMIKPSDVKTENVADYRLTHPKQKDERSKKIKKAALLFIALFILISLVATVKNKLIKLGKPQNNNATLGQKVEVNSPLKTIDINKEFQFPLTDSKGKEVSKIKYVLEKAELRDEIIVKGQKATAVKGRVFLIVYLKITNQFTQKVEMNTKDYVRLSINGNEDEWLAPDIHNDPVDVQAQSTKVTRLGFPVNESDIKLILRVGQINGDKEKVELNF